MTNPRTLRRFFRRPLTRITGLLLLPALVAAGGTAVGTAAEESDRPVERWANNVWEAARGGDVSSMEAYFDAVPSEHLANESADRFRESLSRLRTNRADAREKQVGRRDAALDEMRTESGEGHLSTALRKAVEAQTYSDDLNSAFDNEEIMTLVRWAEDRVPVEEAERHWLDAQQLLYLLRTFYEDTDRRDEFDRFDKRLEQVNRRVSLVALYAPEQLHAMRNERAERLGEEPYGEFNPATAVDWHERIEGVNHKMLKHSLRTAAAEHIETGGWRPLLEGGLDALGLLASTDAIVPTFPSLDDAEAVRRWNRHLQEARQALAQTPDEDLDHWTLTDTLDALDRHNKATINLPRGIVLREFGDGAVDRLDSYSEIIWPDKIRRFQQATAGNFIGVGILIRHNDKREIMVVNPLEGTPAYFEGVKPNDLITEVNGDSTMGWSLNDAVDRITGPKGTVVKLGLQREDVDKTLTIPIVRAVIKIRSVKGWRKEGLDPSGDPDWDWYIDPFSRIAYIRLTQFTEDSFNDLRVAWREMQADGPPSGLILDLRHNPGGLLTSAVQISNLFIAEGAIVTGEDKNGKQAWRQKARANFAELSGVPTVVLVNRGSASASEIVAGCLQAHNAAIIVGERTFGKGSVQTIHHVAPRGRLKLTTQYYRLPSPDGGRTKGRLVHRRPGADLWGVDPDVEVPMTIQQVADAINLRQAAEIIPLDDAGNLDPDDPERPDVNALLVDGTDPQLAMALIILQARAMADDPARHALRRAG